MPRTSYWRRILAFALAVLSALPVLFALIVVIYALSERTVFVNASLGFENPLRIPPLLEPNTMSGKRVFDLRIQSGTTEILKGKATGTWGVNGPHLGPTIRVRRGDRVVFNVANGLAETTTLHWHGMELPAAMDGGPHQEIEPGRTWRPHWTVENQAATLWYHPHQMGRTAEHVYRGVAGLLIVEDANSDQLDLPKTYGEDDLPIIVQDRTFDSAGTLRYNPSHDGFFGDTILVNGTFAPLVDVPRKLVRLRLLNASNARRYNFGFNDNRSFHQVASDGGFLETPVAHQRLLLTPGERAEIVVDMSGGGAATLMSFAVEDHDNIVSNFGKWVLGVMGDENQEFKILQLRARGHASVPTALPAKLNEINRLATTAAEQMRRFVLDDDHTINGKTMDHNRIDEAVRAGATEIWEIVSSSIRSHPFHIHGVQFQVVDRNGRLPPAHEQGWKDTVAVTSGETVRVIMRFPRYSDPDRPFMYHCHLLEHEDRGMMGQFVLVDEPAGVSRTLRRAVAPAAIEHSH